MAKAKKEEVAIEEVVVQEVVVNPLTQGLPSRDFRMEGMVWNPFIGKYVWPSTEEPVADEVQTTEEPITE